MSLPHIDTAYKLIGAGVVGYGVNWVLSWLKHCFWEGLRDGFVASVKKGAPLTPEELAAVRAKTMERLNAEWQRKMSRLANAIEDDEASARDAGGTPQK